MNLLLKILMMVIVSPIVISAAVAADGPSGLTFHGRVIKPGGAPLEAGSVQFTLQIVSPGSESCLLFEEAHTVNMIDSDGIFTLNIGLGTRTANDTGLALSQVFSNAANLSSLTCASGTTFTASTGQSRKVRVSFNDGTETIAFNSDYTVNSLPYALHADHLGGRTSSEFVQTTTDTTQAKLNALMTTTNYSELLALLSGSSTLYTPLSGGTMTGNLSVDGNLAVGSQKTLGFGTYDNGAETTLASSLTAFTAVRFNFACGVN